MRLSERWAPARLDAGWACRRYEEVRARLPGARFPFQSFQARDLADLVDEFDAFVLDGYGVLNIGTDPVPGGVKRIAQLRDAGKQVIVLTNGATYPHARTVERYTRLGYDFRPEEIVSSRDALAEALAGSGGLRWGFAATKDSAIGELAPRGFLLGDDPAGYDGADGFVLLSTGDWTRERHQRMVTALRHRPRQVLVGNPDIVAPRETGLSAEPGLYAHALADATGVAPEFYGKPFANAMTLAARRIRPGVPRRRIAMVGDTPHTDILGGAATGWRTVLVTGHGLLKGMRQGEIDDLSDIRADFIVPTT